MLLMLFFHYLLLHSCIAARGIIPSKDAKAAYPGVEISGTTKTWVPQLIRQDLRARAPIDESVSTSYPAHKAVRRMEKELGWDPKTSAFVNASAIVQMSKAGVGTIPVDAMAHAQNVLAGRRVAELLDIVVPTIRNLQFL